MTTTKNPKNPKKSKTTKKTGIHYSCDTCDCNNCKLWRPASVFANEVELICWLCLEAKGYTVNYGKPSGIYQSDQVYDSKIGWQNWLPAVPDIDGSWWGYTSVPIWWVNWWKSLPNHKNNCLVCCGSCKNEQYTCFKCNGSGNNK